MPGYSATPAYAPSASYMPDATDYSAVPDAPYDPSAPVVSAESGKITTYRIFNESSIFFRLFYL